MPRRKRHDESHEAFPGEGRPVSSMAEAEALHGPVLSEAEARELMEHAPHLNARCTTTPSSPVLGRCDTCGSDVIRRGDKGGNFCVGCCRVDAEKILGVA